jgi:hypothetical protein
VEVAGSETGVTPKKRDNRRERVLMEKIFLLIIVGFLITLAPLAYMMFDFVRYYLPSKPANYEMPSLKDFWIMIMSAIFFLVFEPIFGKWAYPYYYAICNE